MPRAVPNTFVVQLFLLLWLFVVVAIHAKESPVFLIGPEPQPLLPARSDLAPRRFPDGVFLPAASVPLFSNGVDGKRNLNEPRSPKTAAATTTYEGGNRRNKVSTYKSGRDNHATADPALRYLQATCTITTTLLSFNYTDDFDETGTTWIPPDPHGAVGASRLVAVGNSMMEVRQKDGTLMLRDGFRSFFATTYPEALESNFFFDPRVIYDEHQGRFVIAVLQRRYAPDVSRIWLAISKSETPDTIGDWHLYFINSAVTIAGDTTWADFPGLEVDEEAVYITNNMYRFVDGKFVGTRLWVVFKGVINGAYSGGELSYYKTDPFEKEGIAGTTMPAQVHGANGVDGSVGTFLSTVIVYETGQAYLQIVTVFNPLTSPSYTILTHDLGIISQGPIMPLAPQLGSSTKIATNDARILDAVWRSNKLWIVFVINPIDGVNQNQATAHWVRCSTSGGIVSVEAQGDIGGEDIASGAFTFFPSVAVNRRGLVAYGYSASSQTTYAGAYASVGTSQQSYTVKSGLAPYVRKYTNDRNRWGDYTGISVDPTDDSFWAFNQYADTVGSADDGGNGRWATVWGRLLCMPTPTPAPVQPTTPAPVQPTTPAPVQTPTEICAITWKLYDSKTNLAVAALTNGVTISNPPVCGKANIEAVVPCGALLETVTFELWRGSKLVKRQKETKIPYFLFGNKNADVKDGKIASGSYGIRVLVNGVMSPFTNFTIGGQCS